jgi:pentatricopeptide repeat protein
MGVEAIDLYRKMPENQRNPITHVCVLSACSHAGLVDQARSIFSQIEQKTDQVITTMVGWLLASLLICGSIDDTCLIIQVDCLSRVFFFDEAQTLIDDYEKSNPVFLIGI